MTGGRSTSWSYAGSLQRLSLDAQWKTLKVNFDAGGEPYTATGGVLVEPGWRKVYPYSEAKDHVLPRFTEGEKLPIKEKRLEEKETLPPPRYTQAKLIQRMEELGLGTKSTRHEVIGKLVSRKYVEGNPLRPSLVGMAVIGSLEDHADTITKPDMTQMLEEHMNLIKERQRNRDDVVRESREMLHRVFDQLEAHGQEIGDEIMDQTAEEMTLGPCPVCGKDIRIRHLRSQAQFIGCTNYPECTFNIGLPMAMWGFAVRTDDICPKHGLHHVTLVKKGARPWEIGCPLCHHITSNKETLDLVPTMTDEIKGQPPQKAHLYGLRGREIREGRYYCRNRAVRGKCGKTCERGRRSAGTPAETFGMQEICEKTSPATPGPEPFSNREKTPCCRDR